MHALHLLQAEHVRACLGTAAASDPRFDDVASLKDAIAGASIIICNPTWNEQQLAQVRSLTNAKLAASVNAHEAKLAKVADADPKGSAWYKEFWSAIRQRCQPDAEINLGLEAAEVLVATTERMTAGYDATYFDETWMAAPDWILNQWAARGVPAVVARQRWQRIRDYIVRLVSQWTIYNTGSSWPGQRGTFRPYLNDNTISIESNHGTREQILRVAAEFSEPIICWNPTNNPSSIALGSIEEDGLVMRGDRLPTGVR